MSVVWTIVRVLRRLFLPLLAGGTHHGDLFQAMGGLTRRQERHQDGLYVRAATTAQRIVQRTAFDSWTRLTDNRFPT